MIFKKTLYYKLKFEITFLRNICQGEGISYQFPNTIKGEAADVVLQLAC
jgi:hypothetical protein